MIDSENFRLERDSSAASKRDLNHLVICGSRTQLKIGGKKIIRQFTLLTGYLLFIIEDCPFEEMLRIVYIGKQLSKIESISIGLPYTPGILNDLVCVGSNSIEFSFFGDDRWRIVVYTSPRFASPFPKKLGGVHNAIPRFKRHLQVHRLH